GKLTRGSTPIRFELGVSLPTNRSDFREAFEQVSDEPVEGNRKGDTYIYHHHVSVLIPFSIPSPFPFPCVATQSGSSIGQRISAFGPSACGCSAAAFAL